MNDIYIKLAGIDKALNMESFITTENKEGNVYKSVFGKGWEIDTRELEELGVDVCAIDTYIRQLLHVKKRELEKELAKTLCDKVE